jgi:triphosphatase
LKYFLHHLAWVEPAKQLKLLTAKTGNYRKKIENSQALLAQLKMEKQRFPEADEMIALFYSSQFNALQLDILTLIFHEDVDIKRQSIADKEPASLYRFANQWLQSSLEEVIEAMPQAKIMASKDYIKEHRVLIRSLLTGSWFGSLYQEDERLDFRSPWIDIQQGMDELETLWLLKKQLENVEQDNTQKLINWLDTKVEGLLAAMEQSRKMAISLPPYWG